MAREAYLVLAYLLLTFWRVDVTPLLASAGIAGIAVGFAARDAIANFFGSIALYPDGTHRVGDYIVIESGERGRGGHLLNKAVYERFAEAGIEVPFPQREVRVETVGDPSDGVERRDRAV